jgi:hypothetical protein
MKSHLEFITVNGVQFDIEFEFSETSTPVQIISVNKVSGIYLSPDFIDDCQFACSNFLVRQETKAEEESDQSRGN